MTGGRFVAFAGMGSALPQRVVPNSYFESLIDTTDEWIRDRTGIGARRFVAEGENTSDLVVRAAEQALQSAGMAREQIDMLVVATFTPDRPLPATAVMAQAKLGISCPAFDVNAACAGFSYATTVATGLIAAGSAERVMVVGADVLSRKLDFSDRGTCVLFGDGAGAAILQVADDPGVLASSLAADGSLADVLTIPAGGVELAVTAEAIASGEDKLRMTSGREVFKRAVVAMTDASPCNRPGTAGRRMKNGGATDLQSVQTPSPGDDEDRRMAPTAERSRGSGGRPSVSLGGGIGGPALE